MERRAVRHAVRACLLGGDVVGDLPAQVGRDVEVLCVRAAVGVHAAVDPAGDAVADLEVDARVRRGGHHCAGVVAPDDGALGRQPRDVLPVGRVLGGIRWAVCGEIFARGREGGKGKGGCVAEVAEKDDVTSVTKRQK